MLASFKLSSVVKLGDITENKKNIFVLKASFLC